MGIKPYPVYAYRCGQWEEVLTDELFPGDLISLVRTKEDSGLPCDAVLISGGCIVNEAMLSGESTPLLKESVALRPENETLDTAGLDKNSLLYGGTKVLQTTPPTEGHELQAPDDGVLAVVTRTGFETSQGSLVRTMIYSTERVSANNFESLLFILFLLVFAIGASWYVWVEGVRNDRKRSKLLLDCILIITSVVPPELPMELSLAVNTSLAALSKYAIYCTEPFRIPYAGRVDIACFDKTGTLTGSDLVVEGVAGQHSASQSLKGSAAVKQLRQLHSPRQLKNEVQWLLATANALVRLEDGTIVGDPGEKATLDALHWGLLQGDTVIPDAGSVCAGSKAIMRRRFQFSSALKRQSTVSTLQGKDGKKRTFIAVKGAPETIAGMLKDGTEEGYEEAFKGLMREGSRVLGLGYRILEENLPIEKVTE
jgi:manganese-transporting P-type ATPase